MTSPAVNDLMRLLMASPKTPPDRFESRMDLADTLNYLAWVKRQSAVHGRDLRMDEQDYDLKGLYRELGGRDLPVGHGTDRYKKPNHPTFSNESIYHTPDTPGGEWRHENGQDYFYASPHNVKTYGADRLKRYFAEREKGVILVLPPVGK